MAQTVEQNLQVIIGGLIFQVAQLQTQVTQLQEQLAATSVSKKSKD